MALLYCGSLVSFLVMKERRQEGMERERKKDERKRDISYRKLKPLKPGSEIVPSLLLRLNPCVQARACRLWCLPVCDVWMW